MGGGAGRLRRISQPSGPQRRDPAAIPPQCDPCQGPPPEHTPWTLLATVSTVEWAVGEKNSEKERCGRDISK